MDGKAGTGRRWQYLAALVIIYAAYSALVYNRGISLFGEGEVLGNALGILHGKVLYRDTVTVYAPGRFYLLAALFEIFGEKIVVVRLMWLSLRLIGGVLLFFLGRKMMPDIYAFLAGMLYMFASGPWFKSFIVFFNIPVVFCLMRYSDEKKNGWLMAAGLFAGMGILFRQDTGLFMVVLGLLTILLTEGREARHNIRRNCMSAASFLLPAAALLLPAAAYFYTNDALGELYYWCFRWSVTVEHFMGLPFPDVLVMPAITGGWRPLHAYLSTKLFYCLPFIILSAATALLLARLARGGGRKEDRYITIVFLWGCLMGFKYVMTPMYVHVIQAAAPVYVLGCYLLSLLYIRARGWNTGSTAGRAATTTILALTVSIPLFVVYHHVFLADRVPVDYMRMSLDQVRLDIDSAPVYVDRKEAANVEDVTRYVTSRTDGEDCIFADTVPGFYFLTGRDNAGRYGVVQPLLFYRDPSEEKTLVDALRSKAVYLIHKEFTLRRRMTWEFKDYAPLVNRFLREECVLVKEAGPYQVYRNTRLSPNGSPSAP